MGVAPAAEPYGCSRLNRANDRASPKADISVAAVDVVEPVRLPEEVRTEHAGCYRDEYMLEQSTYSAIGCMYLDGYSILALLCDILS